MKPRQGIAKKESDLVLSMRKAAMTYEIAKTMAACICNIPAFAVKTCLFLFIITSLIVSPLEAYNS